MGVKLIGFEKLEAKLTKNMDLSKVKATVKKKRCTVAENGSKRSTGRYTLFTKIYYAGNYRWRHDCRG